MNQPSSRYLIRPTFFFNRAFLLDRAVLRSILAILVISIAIQLIYLWALPISYEGDASVYYRYARWISPLETHHFDFWNRPPGFPLYLHILGMTWLETFNGVIAANTLLGVSMPILLFGSLYPLGNRWALGAALAFSLSTLPFSYAKLFLTEQPYTFLVILLAFSVSRFCVTQKTSYAALSMGAALAALMTRNEAVYLAIFVALLELGLVVSRRNWRAAGAVCVSALVALSITMSWSLERAWLLGQPELFGSLHNYGGWQLFHRVFLSGAEGRWGITPEQQQAIFIEAKNGPASAELDSIIPGALEKPSQEHYGALVMEVMKRADNGANSPGLHKGILYTDNLLRAVIKESVIAHPEILGLIAMSATGYFGIHLPGAKLWPPPFVWAPFDTYQAMPYDIGGQASSSMPKGLFKKYTDSQWNRPAWLIAIPHFGQYALNILRIALGIVLAFTVWFLPLTRFKWLAAYVFGSAMIMIGAAAAGFGYSGRYEHAITPYLLMTATLSVEACVTWIRLLSTRSKTAVT